MAHQFYDYSSLYGGGTLSSSASRSFSRYLLSAAASSSSDSLSKYSMYLSQPDSAGVTAVDTTASLSSWPPPPPPPGVDVSSSVETLLTGTKRSSQALYHQTLLGAQNTIGQTEAWYSATSLAKRPRFESAYNLPIYPQRPGEKDCAHYMLTRTCKFGDSCKFDHPIWVPEGGIPDWKEVPLIDTAGQLPERPGEPDCPYFMKTQRCKYGSKCKFNHPKDRGVSECTEATALPERPSEPPCAFYLKTGKCKFGATCKFHHPKDIQLSTVGEFDVNGEQTESVIRNEGQASMGNTSVNTPAQYINSKGLPVRPGEVDCPFYLKTGSCKYGVTCRYNHPDRNAINPPAAAMGTYAAPTAADLSVGVASPVSSLYQSIYPGLVQPLMGLRSTIYPQRPGQTECDYYMRTGECKFGERCKFHHPINRSLPTQKQAQEQSVKLTLAGLPRREGAVHCPYYMKTGTCMFGVTCKFDHPPPGEVIAQGVSTSATTEPNSG